MRTTLDPDARAVIDAVQESGIPEWHAMSVDCCRRIEDEVFSGGSGEPPVAQVRDLAFESPAGEVPVRLYWPETGRELPLLVYFHGGGWVVGTLDGVDDICRTLAVEAECIVASVDYHLAPEHPFPAPVEDAHAAVTWAAENATEFGADPERVGVAGTSAGGNLAAVAALAARERGGPTPAFQLLLYPITNRAFDTDSYAENAAGDLLSERTMRWFWNRYLVSEFDAHNPFASPLRAPDLSGLPPATVVTGGFDPLRDEGAAYAGRLERAGVDVTHRNYPSMPHGFLSMTDDVARADEAMGEVTDDLRAGLR